MQIRKRYKNTISNEKRGEGQAKVLVELGQANHTNLVYASQRLLKQYEAKHQKVREAYTQLTEEP
jgi:hypothetical protein